MANMRRSRTGDWSVVIGPGPTVHFVYIFSFSSLVRVLANLRRCLHYHIIYTMSSLYALLRLCVHLIRPDVFTDVIYLPLSIL